MPKVICLSHQKGGVGKSTLAINMANSFKDNVRTAIMDMDPQGTVTQLAPHFEGITVIPYNEKFYELDFDVIFIDTPPYLSDFLISIYQKSDLIIVPCKVGIADMLAIRSTVALIKTAQMHNPRLKAGIVLNMVQLNTTLTDEVILELGKFGMPIFKSMISQRVNFARSVAMKNGIFDMGDNKAEKELNNFVKEVLLLLNT